MISNWNDRVSTNIIDIEKSAAKLGDLVFEKVYCYLSYLRGLKGSGTSINESIVFANCAVYKREGLLKYQ